MLVYIYILTYYIIAYSRIAYHAGRPEKEHIVRHIDQKLEAFYTYTHTLYTIIDYD